MPDGDAVDKLFDLRTQFGGSRRRKYRALLRASRLDLDEPDALRRYHEVLLFLAAYPDDADVLRIVQSELRRVARSAASLAGDRNRRFARRLDDSGIAGTVNHCSFSLDCVDWLAHRFPRDVEIDWEDDSAGDALDEFLPSLAAHVERDGALSDRLSTRAWIQLAAGAKRNGLSWLVERFGRSGCGGDFLDRAFDSLELQVRWVLRDRAASRTWIRFPARRVFYQTDGLQRRVRLADMLRLPLPPARTLNAGGSRALIDVGRATLCARHRETDPLTYANPSEVTLFSLERGVDVALFGMLPDRRLPIESYIGFVAARNRVPVGYGGGWVLFDRCEIGVNVFDTFRGGESAFIFAQVLRVFVQHYRAKRITVDPFQIGAGNPEAIRSGAFWFYYRLGFRPTDSKLSALAEGEWSGIRADRAYRCPTRKLRKLARSKLALSLGADSSTGSLELADIGLAVTARVGKQFGGDRGRAERAASVEVLRALGVRGRSKWPPAESAAFNRLSLLVGMIPGLGSWTVDEKKSLVSLMRAKGGRRERAYVLKLQRHRCFRAALEAIARKGRELVPND